MQLQPNVADFNFLDQGTNAARRQESARPTRAGVLVACPSTGHRFRPAGFRNGRAFFGHNPVGLHGGLLLRSTNARFASCHPGFLTPPIGRNRNRGRTIGARIGEYFPIFTYREEPGLVPFCPVEVFRDRKDKRDGPHGGDGEYTGTWPGRLNGSAGSIERASSTWLRLIKRAIRCLPSSRQTLPLIQGMAPGRWCFNEICHFKKTSPKERWSVSVGGSSPGSAGREQCPLTR